MRALFENDVIFYGGTVVMTAGLTLFFHWLGVF